MHSRRLPAGRAPGMARVSPLSHHPISRECLSESSGIFFACCTVREGVKNPRKGSTKRQDRRFAQPQAARRASARDGAREPPLSPPYFKRMPERKFRHFFCLLHRQRGREEPSPGVDKTAGPPFCTAAGLRCRAVQNVIGRTNGLLDCPHLHYS